MCHVFLCFPAPMSLFWHKTLHQQSFKVGNLASEAHISEYVVMEVLRVRRNYLSEISAIVWDCQNVVSELSQTSSFETYETPDLGSLRHHCLGPLEQRSWDRRNTDLHNYKTWLFSFWYIAITRHDTSLTVRRFCSNDKRLLCNRRGEILSDNNCLYFRFIKGRWCIVYSRDRCNCGVGICVRHAASS